MLSMELEGTAANPGRSQAARAAAVAVAAAAASEPHQVVASFIRAIWLGNGRTSEEGTSLAAIALRSSVSRRFRT